MKDRSWKFGDISFMTMTGSTSASDPLLTKDSYGKTTNLRLYTNVAFDWLSIITWSCRNLALIGIQKIQPLFLQISSHFFGKSHFLELFLWIGYWLITLQRRQDKSWDWNLNSELLSQNWYSIHKTVLFWGIAPPKIEGVESCFKSSQVSLNLKP